MPTLNWIGKEAVVNHHRHVPYRLLHCDRSKSAGDPDSGNLLVQGDNLEALKALLPYYAGKVKCIYIDPPYNTGNENWIYNDNVNSPQIKKWLGQVVGKEAEDLTRHDKWLCMMYPRLALLREFLSEDGVILISLDDAEQHNLRQLMNELFGPQNFVASLVWAAGRKNDSKLISVSHEYVTCFVKNRVLLQARGEEWRQRKKGIEDIYREHTKIVRRVGTDYAEATKALKAWFKTLPADHPARQSDHYSHVDERGVYFPDNISWPGGGGPTYDVLHPRTGLPCRVPSRGWLYAQPARMMRAVAENRVHFGNDENAVPCLKSYLKDREMQVPYSVIYQDGRAATKRLREIMGGDVFEHPKDEQVIAELLAFTSAGTSLILDSFAGSGTTGHAVLQMNKADGGNRRFICIEMDETIAREVTAQRLKRVVEGYEAGGRAGANAVPGLGGGFRFCTLGIPLFDEYGSIDPEVKYNDLAAHVFFSETGSPLPKRRPSPPPSPGVPGEGAMLGVFEGRAVYLLFNGILGDKKPDGGNVLTGAVLESLPKHGGPKVIYGEACRLGEARLRAADVTFKQVPWEVRVG